MNTSFELKARRFQRDAWQRLGQARELKLLISFHGEYACADRAQLQDHVASARAKARLARTYRILARMP